MSSLFLLSRGRAVELKKDGMAKEPEPKPKNRFSCGIRASTARKSLVTALPTLFTGTSRSTFGTSNGGSVRVGSVKVGSDGRRPSLNPHGFNPAAGAAAALMTANATAAVKHRLIIRTLMDYDSFGEEEFLSGERAEYSVRATSYCDLMVLTQQAFEEVRLRHPALHELLKPLETDKLSTGEKSIVNVKGSKKKGLHGKLSGTSRQLSTASLRREDEGEKVTKLQALVRGRAARKRTVKLRSERASQEASNGIHFTVGSQISSVKIVAQ